MMTIMTMIMTISHNFKTTKQEGQWEIENLNDSIWTILMSRNHIYAKHSTKFLWLCSFYLIFTYNIFIFLSTAEYTYISKVRMLLRTAQLIWHVTKVGPMKSWLAVYLAVFTVNLIQTSRYKRRVCSKKEDISLVYYNILLWHLMTTIVVVLHC